LGTIVIIASTHLGEAKMVVEDDVAWREWSDALEKVKLASTIYDEVRSMPDGHPSKQSAWVALKSVYSALSHAANKIEPRVTS
jgi:hypothetical protein